MAAPWIGLATAVSLGLASSFYRFAEPPRLKVWRRLTLAVILGGLSTVALLRFQDMADARTREVVLKELAEHGVADGRIHWREDVLAALRSGLLPETIYRVGGEVATPTPLETPAPPYPQGLSETHDKAHLLLDLVIDAEGKVREVWAYDRLPLGFGESIPKTVRRWRYVPAMRGDEPVAVYYTVAVRVGEEGREVGGAAPTAPAAATVMASGLREILVFELADGATSLAIHRTGGSSQECELTPTVAETWNQLVATVERGDSRTAEFLGLEQPCSGAVAAVARARADGKLDVWQIGTDAEPEAVDVAAAAIRVLLDLCGTGLSFEAPRLVLVPSRGVEGPKFDRDR